MPLELEKKSQRPNVHIRDRHVFAKPIITNLVFFDERQLFFKNPSSTGPL